MPTVAVKERRIPGSDRLQVSNLLDNGARLVYDMGAKMRTTAVVAGLSMIALTACARGDDTSATGDTTAATSATATPPASALTDANILGFLDEVNVADSSFGKIASTKGTHADVKAYGVLMMDDHHALRQAVHDLAVKLGVTPATPPNDSLPMKAQKISDSLNAIPKGAAFDKAYLDDEISNHQVALSFIENALATTQNAELKDLLAKARPNIEMHLKRAQDIRSRIGTEGTP